MQPGLNVLRSLASPIVLAIACSSVAACAGHPDRAATPTADSTATSPTSIALQVHDTAVHDTAVHDTAVHDTAVHDTTAHDTMTRDSARVPTLADTLDPTVTLRAYLDRARRHRATGDTLIWEPPADGTTGFPSSSKVRIVSFSIGAPGPIEGAAGSRYVTIPFTAVVSNGVTSGEARPKATLRRAVVDGATNAQRRWRIVRIDWSVR